VAIAVRTAVFDELLLGAVRERGVDTVLNLAAGLDARPYRLPLPAALRWIEVDFPDLLAHKEAHLAGERPACAVERVPLDLADVAARRGLFARVAAEARSALVITEGLVVYLDDGEVAALARDLHAHAAFAGWIVDVGSPELLRWQKRQWGDQLGDRAPMKFGHGAEFFQPHGFRVAELRSWFLEARRLRRLPAVAALMRLVYRLSGEARRERMRRLASYVLLEREG
jgi:methyltransferase (TIGR00027 family)